MSSKSHCSEITVEERSLVDYLEPSLTYLIDGQPLQIMIREASGDDSMLGLVSPWLGNLYSDKEQAIVNAKLDLRSAESCRVPVLVCSDDLDLACTVVIADVFVDEKFVKWKQIGIDATPSTNPEDIGRIIERIDGLPELKFRRNQYEACY